jgi:HTH-type transcriptional regulator / antitoxin HigA
MNRSSEEIGKMTTEELEVHWANIVPLLTIRNEHEYNATIKQLNELLDEIGDNEKHPLYSLLDTLGTLIHAYEEEHYPIPDVTGAEVGSQGVVSEILSGKRDLNVRQIRSLAQRFGVSSAVFV